jgi:hypothetical protein
MNKKLLIGLCLGSLFQPLLTEAAVLTFSAADFGKTPVFSTVQTFSFMIDIDGPLAAGDVFNNPALNGVEYNVFGQLAPGTPSDFPAFNLERTISGADFYAQGSSLSFEIAATADLSDGLQVSELVGSDPIFVFNGRELDTGRYHPALFQLNSNGTGSIQNSNNIGGINPASGEVVNVDFGDEYITDLTFDPGQLTLAAAVPVPAAVWLFGSGLLGLIGMAKRKKSIGSDSIDFTPGLKGL